MACGPPHKLRGDLVLLWTLKKPSVDLGMCWTLKRIQTDTQRTGRRRPALCEPHPQAQALLLGYHSESHALDRT